MKLAELIRALAAAIETQDPTDAILRATRELGLPALGEAIERASRAESLAAALALVVVAVDDIEAEALRQDAETIEAMLDEADEEDLQGLLGR
jgi:hypothetical protein